MAINHLTRDHVLEILDYYPHYNCTTPAKPTADSLLSEIAEVSSKLDGVEDIDEIGPLVKELNSIDAPDFSDFIEYHGNVYEKMDEFRSSIVKALEVSGGVHDSSDLEYLSVDQLISMVEDMRSELSEHLPYAGTVSAYISSNKIVPLFAEVLLALGLKHSTMLPNISRGEYECSSTNPNIRAVWVGHALYVYRNGCVLNVTEDMIGMQLPGDERYHRIKVSDVKKIFPEWTKPTKEQGDLFRMLYPNHQYNLDKIFGDI
ncbi:hypothetical protein CHUUTOTORO_02020 [Serratia phage vB_SmaM-ChuuTotoro]|nr:hypothetical protein CHUUTOTORO_02020 [Serratia phage vB_SmaM-ChuuTotoro]